MKTKLYDLPIKPIKTIKTFEPERLMEEILKAKDGDVFLLNEENVAEQIGDYWPELTMIQVKKVKEERITDVGMKSNPETITQK